MARIARESVGIFAQAKERLGRDTGYRRAGYLFLTSPPLEAATRASMAMQQQVGIATEWLSAAELAKRYAWLDIDGVAGACFEPEGGYADPVHAVEAFLGAFRDEGGEVRLGAPVRGLMRNGRHITGVVTDAGEVAAGTVVNAAGPWAKPLADSAGIALALRSVREQDTVWEARPDRPLPEQSISNAVDAIYIRPLGGRRYVVGRGFPKDYVDCDPYNYKQTADDGFVADVQARMERRIPPFQGARLVDSYAALYDVTADWYPYVGLRAELDGYADFNGGSGHGFKIAPALGRRLADWIVDGRTNEDFAQLSHDRVAAGRLIAQAYGGNRG
jgi:glycine/D-amino acid oxidase-like deaminating enzyme